MLKRRLLLVSFCAALCAAPLLALIWPARTPIFAGGLPSLDNWQRGLQVGLAVLAVLAWRLNQNRLTVIAVGLLAACALVLRAAESGVPAQTLADAWLVAVPTGLGLSLLPREGSLLSGRTLGRTALLLLPAVLAWAVAGANPAAVAQGLAWRLWQGGPAAQPSQVAYLGLLIFGAAALRRNARIEDALLALGASLLGFTGLVWGLAWAGNGPAALPPLTLARLWLAASLAQGCCLALGLFLLYWQRVYVDELTAIPNRRALDERLGALDASGYSLAMVDIDHFKVFNDTYGHAQGDAVLRMVARHLKDETRDRAYRYGGEEFVVLAPGLDSDELAALMDAARAGLAKRRFHVRRESKKPGVRAKRAASPAGPGVQAQVTISVGVARGDRTRDTTAKVLKLADEGVYAAKAAGRNVVVKKN